MHYQSNQGILERSSVQSGNPYSSYIFEVNKRRSGNPPMAHNPAYMEEVIPWRDCLRSKDQTARLYSSTSYCLQRVMSSVEGNYDGEICLCCFPLATLSLVLSFLSRTVNTCWAKRIQPLAPNLRMVPYASAVVKSCWSSQDSPSRGNGR